MQRWLNETPGLPEDEFIDNIPFPETQNYVKRILGTAEDYRRLYGEGAKVPTVTRPPAKKSAAPAVKRTPTKKSPAKKAPAKTRRPRGNARRAEVAPRTPAHHRDRLRHDPACARHSSHGAGRPRAVSAIAAALHCLKSLRACRGRRRRAIVGSPAACLRRRPGSCRRTPRGDHREPTGRSSNAPASSVPLADGRALISFDQPRTIEELELLLYDALDDTRLTPDDRRIFQGIAAMLREARRSATFPFSAAASSFSSRTIGRP